MAKEKLLKRKGNVVLKKIGEKYWVYVLPNMTNMLRTSSLPKAKWYFKGLTS